MDACCDRLFEVSDVVVTSLFILSAAETYIHTYSYIHTYYSHATYGSALVAK